MPYIVTNSDGSLTVNVADSVVDTSTYSLALIGRNVSNYGQYFAQNTIRHLENFASATAPSPSQRLIGQIWFDKTEQVLRVWDGSVWKRNTGIVLGPANQRPSTSLTGGGTAFFNLTNNKLEVHNGTDFREASYAGEVTSRYSASGIDNQPTAYGTRIRNIFLKDTDGISNPVLAVCYVKSTSAGASDTASPNRGSTLINGQYETIMSLWSDREFIIDTQEAALVDGVTVTDLAAELVSPNGIAGQRAGRAAGKILAGHNTRSEFETTGVTSVNNLFATNIGIDSDGIETPVEQIVVDSLSVKEGLTVGLDVPVILGGDLDVADELTVGGNITTSTGVITTANLVVTANTVLNGITNINGDIVVNGVNSQTIGSSSELIEDYYGANIEVQDLNVSTAADISVVNAGSLNASGDTHLLGNLTVVKQTFLNGPTTISSLEVTGATELNSTLTVEQATTLNEDLTLGLNKNIILQGTGYVQGSVDQVRINTKNDNVNYHVAFATQVSGTTEVNADNELRYNPDSNELKSTNFTATGTMSSVTLTDGTMSLNSGAITGAVSGSFTNTVAAGTFSDGSATMSGGVFSGVSATARYADLAEIYVADQDYIPGTVVKLGGSEEITQTTQEGDADVFGVISTDPAYLMNSEASGSPVAMTGRVPVRVIGPVSKGERLISSGVPGVAKGLGDAEYDPRKVVGRALGSNDTDGEAVIEAVVGVK